MASRVLSGFALALLAASISGPALAAIDIGLCPAVNQALDPNGDGFFEDGDNAQAMSAAESCVAAGSARGFMSRAYVYRRLGKPEQAAADVDQALNRGGERFSALRLSCALLGDAKRYQEARAVCAQAIAAAPNQAVTHFGMAILDLNAADYDEALQEIDRATALNPEDGALWNSRALILEKLQRYDDALAAAEKAAALAPTVFENARMAGVYLMQLKRNDAAVERLTRAVALARTDEDRANGYWNRGRAHELAGDTDAAYADYDRAVALAPKWAQPVWDRGTIKSDRGQYQEAIADFDRAIELDPNFADAYLQRGIANKKLSNLRTALPDLHRAVELNPSSRLGFFYLGVVDDALNNPTAIDDYSRAIAIDPNDADSLNNRAFIYRNQGRTQEALVDYDRALAANPSLEPALFWRARTHAEQGQGEAAIADYSRLLKVDPGYLWAYYNRGELYLTKAGNAAKMPMPGETTDRDIYEAAFRDFDALVDRDKKRDKGTVWTYWAWAGMGARHEPEVMLAKLARLWDQSPEQTDKYVARAGLRLAAGDRDAALADAKHALNLDANNKFALDMVGELAGSKVAPEAANGQSKRGKQDTLCPDGHDCTEIY